MEFTDAIFERFSHIVGSKFLRRLGEDHGPLKIPELGMRDGEYREPKPSMLGVIADQLMCAAGMFQCEWAIAVRADCAGVQDEVVFFVDIES